MLSVIATVVPCSIVGRPGPGNRGATGGDVTGIESVATRGWELSGCQCRGTGSGHGGLAAARQQHLGELDQVGVVGPASGAAQQGTAAVRQRLHQVIEEGVRFGGLCHHLTLHGPARPKPEGAEGRNSVHTIPAFVYTPFDLGVYVGGMVKMVYLEVEW